MCLKLTHKPNLVQNNCSNLHNTRTCTLDPRRCFWGKLVTFVSNRMTFRLNEQLTENTVGRLGSGVICHRKYGSHTTYNVENGCCMERVFRKFCIIKCSLPRANCVANFSNVGILLFRISRNIFNQIFTKSKIEIRITW